MIVFKENSETARFSAKQIGGMEIGPSSAFPTLCVPGMASLYKVSPQHSKNLSFTVRLDFFKATSTRHGGEVMNPNGFLTVHGVINDKDEVQINEHEGGVDKLNGRTDTQVLLGCLELAKSAVRNQIGEA